jgi:hypothetical protein
MATVQAVVEESRPFIGTSQLCLREDQLLLVAFRARFVGALLGALRILRGEGLNVRVELIPQFRPDFSGCGYLHLRQEHICRSCQLSITAKLEGIRSHCCW